MSVDLLRRRSGATRSRRSWDRFQWIVAMLVAVLFVCVGLYASAAQIFGTHVQGAVLSCETELMGRGDVPTPFCDVRLLSPSHARVDSVQMHRTYPVGTVVDLVRFRGDVSEPTVNHGTEWMILVGIIVAIATWSMGLPPRNDPAYGKHAKPPKGAPSGTDDEGTCPRCGHAIRHHPRPHQRDLTACAECVWEEDHDQRDGTDMCRLRYERP